MGGKSNLSVQSVNSFSTTSATTADTQTGVKFSALTGNFSRIYYHRSTFLQLTTIDFLLLFPHPSTSSELSESRGNGSKVMSGFFLQENMFSIRCNSVWTHLFAICGVAVVWFLLLPCGPSNTGKFAFLSLGTWI